MIYLLFLPFSSIIRQDFYFLKVFIMDKSNREGIPSSKNSSSRRAKAISFIKKVAAPLIVATLIGCWWSSDSKQTVIIGEWATLSSVVKDSLGLPEEYTSDPKLCRMLIDSIVADNNIDNPNLIHVNDTLIVDMKKLNWIIEEYNENTYGIQEKDEKKWEDKMKKEQREWGGDTSYTVIHSLEEFNSSNNYFISKIRRDNNISPKFVKTLRDGYSIRFINPMETKNSPTYSVEEIIKPQEVIWSELKGKVFVLDPGHGSMDTGAIGLAQYWDAKNKEKVVVYESAVMMDLVYRVARELKAHWAEVHLTHYMNRRGIQDIKDLPPCFRTFDSQWNEVFQDIWEGTPKDADGSTFWAQGKYLTKRSTIANGHRPNLYVSFHADLLEKTDPRTGQRVIDESSKILSIKYDGRCEKASQSEQLAKDLLANWFGYYFQNDLAPDVKRDVAKQNLWALRHAKTPALLIETGNISQESQAFILREYSKREELAKNFVSSLIKVYKK